VSASRDLFSYLVLMYSHSLVVSRLKVFFIDFHLCSSGTFFIPGSVQHTHVVIEYLGSVYNAFVVLHEGFIFLIYSPLPFFSIFNVLVLRFDSSANTLHVETMACGSKPLLLATCHCFFMVLAQFFSNCLTVEGVIAVLHGLIFSCFASIDAFHVDGSTGVAVVA
jgi:hypothetical protein